MTDAEKRIHAESTFHALHFSRLDLNKNAEAGHVAKELAVPEALVWLAVNGIGIDLVDKLVEWWPRKGDA
jgi:hypothetical protein